MKETIVTFVGALSAVVTSVVVAWLLARVRSGRLGRTFDQATKVIEFVERYSAAYAALQHLPEAVRPKAENLLLNTAQAIQDDFVSERALLPEFGKTTSAFRNALLLYVPRMPAMWVPLVLFHTLLLFMIFVCVARFVGERWSGEDTIALIIAGLAAVLVRIVAHVVSTRASLSSHHGNAKPS